MDRAADQDYVERILARLKRQLTIGPGATFARIHSALEFAGGEGGATLSQVPAAIVVPVSDAGGENRSGGSGALQVISTTIAITVVVPARNDPGGSRARGPLTRCIDEVRAALIGWSPAPSQALRLVRGSLVDIEGGRAWWEDVYEFQRIFNELDNC